MKKLVGMLTIVLIITIPAFLNQSPSLAGTASESKVPKPDRRIILMASGGPANLAFTPPPEAFTGLRAQSSTFTINWRTDGTCQPWPADAKTAFEYAVDIWESIVSSPVTIAVDACWEDLTAKYGEGVLGAAGAADYDYNFPNAPHTNTWYPIALSNSLAGTDLSVYADIDASFNSTFSSWYFGTGSSTPGDKYNFATVVLHEICHGLGFISSLDKPTGINGAYWGSGGMPLVFDHFVENATGENLVEKYPSATLPATSSAALLAELTNNSVFFDGPKANIADGGTHPQLYAPATWSAGSSISHLDEKYNPSTDNRLMTYSLSRGETTYDPGPIVKAIFEDIGWQLKQEEIPVPEPVSTTIPISGGVITTSYETTTTVGFPSGAVTETITITLALTDTGKVTPTLETIGMAFTLDAVRVSDGTPVDAFSETVTITIDYDSDDAWGTRENTMMLYYLDNGEWISATTTCSPTTTPLHDLSGNTFSLGICHLSKFALLAETRRIYLPTILNSSSP